jgi:hypothetical protein
VDEASFKILDVDVALALSSVVRLSLVADDVIEGMTEGMVEELV